MSSRIIRLQDIVEEVQKHHPDLDTDLIEKAYIFSAKAHEGQLRLSGEPYLSHPLEVAYLLATMGLGPVTVSSGLLHDTVEDSAATLDDLEEYFGEEVADVVNGVTKIGQLVFGDRQTQQAEYIRKMILSMSHDIRVLLVKLADRVHNMRTLGIMEPAKQRRISRETLISMRPWPAAWACSASRPNWKTCPSSTWNPRPTSRSGKGCSGRRAPWKNITRTCASSSGKNWRSTTSRGK